ncbi:MAG: ABC transporter ATP-binding protein [Clostridia bacterium]
MSKHNNPNKINYYLFKELPALVLTIVFGVIYNIAFVFVPMFQGKLLDTVIYQKPLNTVLFFAGIFIGVVLLTQITRYFKRYYVRNFANKTKRTMRKIMYQNTINLSISALDKVEVGDIMTRCIGDVDITVEGMRKSITEILDTGVAMASYIVVLLVYDVMSTLISCSFILLAMLIALLLKRTVYKFNKSYRESSSAFTSNTYQLTSNTILFRNYGVMEKHISSFENRALDTKTKAIKASLIENSLPPIYKLIASIGVIFVIYFGAKKTFNGGVWSIGKFTAYLTLFLQFTIKASKISNLFNSIQKATISWNRTKKYFNTATISDKENIKLDNINLNAQNLSFEYTTNTPIFEPINFSAKQGDIVGVVGVVASGKTSALLALSGLYGYTGNIQINGKELSEYNKNALSNCISYSAHNAFLLDDTIAENISVGRSVDVKSLLSDVCFDVDLQAMPAAENTLVGNSGVRLSGGQQARLSLARALGGANKIVLLDDPFSAVDQVTEAKIIENLKQNHTDKIFIIASHRPTIYNYANKIIQIKPIQNTVNLQNNEAHDA